MATIILEDAKRFHTIGCSAQTRNGGEKYIQGKMDEAIEADVYKRQEQDTPASEAGNGAAARETPAQTLSERRTAEYLPEP